MGRPDDPKKYREIMIDGLHIFIDKDILKNIGGQKKILKFVLEGYGWFRLPIQGLLTENKQPPNH